MTLSDGSDQTGAGALERWFAALDHPRKAEVAALCAFITDTCPGLRQGIKWNAPSYGWPGQDDALTLRTHPAPAFQLILHRGAKPLADPPPVPHAPKGLVIWKGNQRGVVDFAARPVAQVHDALASLIRDWMNP